MPLSRIQGLDTVAGPGAAAVRRRGASACRPRAAAPRARSCSRRSARRRSSGCARRCARAAPRSPRRRRQVALPERRLSRRDGLIAALTAGQLGVILPVLAAGIAAAARRCSATRATSRTRRGWLPDSAGRLGARGRRAAASLAWALSVAGSLVAFAGFTVTRDGERLRIRRGLLQRSEAAVPVRRVHGVRVVEGLLRRPFGLCDAARRGRGLRRRGARPRARCSRCCGAATSSRSSPSCCPSWPTSPSGLAPPPRARRAPLRAAGRAGRGGRWAAPPACSSRASRRGRCCSRRCSRSTAGSTTARPAGGCATAGSP